ncbi:hypothetical protein LCGC14_2180770 [marine sediment metagenome]|uniref:DUF1738 domain-containing protein n=1 Tax=marine sediment metagenome TaxID=412755 RepID=A0A0F9DMD0_9ZZZZ
MPSQKQIRQQITDRIVAALEKNLLPWRRPWRSSPNAGRPASVVSKKAYRGINPILLELHSLRFDFQSRWWATYKQWHDLGCVVKKRPDDVEPGQWGASIVFYRQVSKTVTDDNGQERDERFPLMRTFTVFNVEQVEGEFAEKYQVQDEPTTGETSPDFEPADELIAATEAEIRHAGDRAFYKRPVPFNDWPEHRDGDYIVVPPKHRFDPVGSYYETILHELAHWSEIRTSWDHRERGYAMGELAAEIAASFMAAELRVPQGESIENHVAYLKSWLAAMKNDPSYIFKASTQASKVTDFLLAFTRQPEEVVV